MARGFTFSLFWMPWLEAGLGLKGLMPHYWAGFTLTRVYAGKCYVQWYMHWSLFWQRQCWNLVQLHSLQVCTLSLAVAASTLVRNSPLARGTGAGTWGDTQAVLSMWPEPRQFSVCFFLVVTGTSKSVCAFSMSNALVSYSPLGSPTVFKPAERACLPNDKPQDWGM